MLAFSHTSRRNLKTYLAPTAAATSLCTIALLGLAATPAHAESPVSPPEHDVFVISPDDGGRCPFPVQWDITTRSFGLDLPHQFFGMSPAWSVTITNLDTGKTLTPHGDGSIRFTELPDGTAVETSDGVNYAPFRAFQLVGHLTLTFSPDGDVSDWTGPGQVIDLCALLS